MKASLILILFSVLLNFNLSAHSGRTNSYGCHNNHQTGDYHCHGSYLKKEIREGRKPSSALDSNFNEESVAENQQCCRVCSVGKACGDSCISRNETCHKGAGCACDG
ncbi:MAG: hypothetical protein CME64_08930 [Halobacteriovoraceae bacterium]|nr:hypothetical protein [Halobacteriovoraceae bacterium]